MELIFMVLFSAVFSICNAIGVSLLTFRDNFTEKDSFNYKALNRGGKFNRYSMVAMSVLSAVLSFVFFILNA